MRIEMGKTLQESEQEKKNSVNQEIFKKPDNVGMNFFKESGRFRTLFPFLLYLS